MFSQLPHNFSLRDEPRSSASNVDRTYNQLELILNYVLARISAGPAVYLNIVWNLIGQPT